MDRDFKRDFSAPLPVAALEEPAAGGALAAARAAAGSALGEGAGGLLQMPSVLRKCPCFKRLLFGNTLRRPMGRRAWPAAAQRGGEAQEHGYG